MTILLKKTRGLLATILCIILLAANVLLVSADSEGDGDSGGAQQLEAGYILKVPPKREKIYLYNWERRATNFQRLYWRRRN